MTGELTLIAAKIDGLERVERELGPVVEELEAFAFDAPNLEEPIVLRPSTVRYPEDGTTSAELLSALSAGRRST